MLKFSISKSILHYNNLLQCNTLQFNKYYIGSSRKFSSVLCQVHYKHEHTSTCVLLVSSSAIFSKRSISLVWLDDISVSQAKWFQGLSESAAVGKITTALQDFHSISHMPWWLSIIVSTAILRTFITFPLAVYQNYILAKVENIHIEMSGLVTDLKKETAVAVKTFGWDKNYTRYMYNRSAKKLWRELIIRENCHPFKASLLLYFQLPLWIMVSISLRNMASMRPRFDAAAQIIFMELSVGGFGWIPNMTDVDHSWILPVAMGLINLAITEIHVLSRPILQSNLQKYATNFFRLISIGLIPVAAYVPSCVVLYWVTSSSCGLVQNLVLLSPKVRRFFKIPVAPSEKKHPYSYVWQRFQQKMNVYSNT